MEKLFALFEKNFFWTLVWKFLEHSCDGCLLFRFFSKFPGQKFSGSKSFRAFWDLSGSKIVIIVRKLGRFSLLNEKKMRFSYQEVRKKNWNQKIRKKIDPRSPKNSKNFRPRKFKKFWNRKDFGLISSKKIRIQSSNNFRVRKIFDLRPRKFEQN